MIALNLPKLSFQAVWKLETCWKLKLSKTNALTPISVSSWKPRLETWKPCLRLLSARVTGENSVSSLYPTPYRGSGYSPALTLGDPHQCHWHHFSSQSKNLVAMHPAKNVIATLTTQQAKERRYG